jgi:hypothetical protein
LPSEHGMEALENKTKNELIIGKGILLNFPTSKIRTEVAAEPSFKQIN